MLAAILICGTSTMLTSCSDNEDNPVGTFDPASVVGKWYVEAYQHSTIGEGEDAFEFDKVAIYGNLNADGTGSWYAFFFNAYGNLIDTGNLFFGSGCHYTTTADGGVHIVLDGESSASLLMPSWDMTYRGGRLISADANDLIELSRITAEQDALVQMWLRILGLGYGGEENIVDLSQLRSSYVAQDGDVLTGEYKVNGRISVADGATVTLRNCKILNNQTVVDRHPAIVCKGSATLILKGDNELKGGAGDYPAIYIQQGNTLTIGGYGTLLVSVHGMAAAIGSGNASDSKNSGNIVIKSGHINAYGSVQSAAIGSSQTGTCGDITIEGGEVNAWGDTNGAGIGSGYYGKCGNITIGNSLVMSYGGSNGSGIGGGSHGSCKTITINGGTVKAYGGRNFPGIGVGNDSGNTCDGIKINGGDIYVEGGENGCIGMGAQMNSESKCGPIIISNKIKTLEVYNPGASGTNLRTVIFGETIEFGNTKQALNFMLYLLVHLEKEYDEVKQDVHYEIFKDGKRFRITPLK